MSLLSPSQIWTSALGSLQVQISQPSYNTWLKNTVGLSWDGKQMVVGAPSVFIAEWLEQRMSSLLEETLSSITGGPATISFTVGSDSPSAVQTPGRSPASLEQNNRAGSAIRSQPAPLGLNAKYTLDSFVVGESNQLAYAAAVAVSTQPGQTSTPLFL